MVVCGFISFSVLFVLSFQPYVCTYTYRYWYTPGSMPVSVPINAHIHAYIYDDISHTESRRHESTIYLHNIVIHIVRNAKKRKEKKTIFRFIINKNIQERIYLGIGILGSWRDSTSTENVYACAPI